MLVVAVGTAGSPADTGTFFSLMCLSQGPADHIEILLWFWLGFVLKPFSFSAFAALSVKSLV